jgi:WD40 repeat protein
LVGFANGSVKIVTPNGILACELSAHSRSLNALTCHPTKSIFATCSDDTFMSVFEISGDSFERIDVNLILSSRVNDYQLCGVQFGGDTFNSIVAAPYDFKTLAVWNNIV